VLLGIAVIGGGFFMIISQSLSENINSLIATLKWSIASEVKNVFEQLLPCSSLTYSKSPKYLTMDNL
jgi:hypothetical protein